MTTRPSLTKTSCLRWRSWIATACRDFSSKGTDADGDPIDDSAEIITEYTKDPERRLLMTFVDNADPSAEQRPWIFQIGQDMYMFGGEDVGWMRISTEDFPSPTPNYP